MMGNLYVAFLLLQLTVPALGLYKRWTRSTNFGDPENWNAKRAPCGNDVVIIPDEIPVVYIQTNTTLKELALPNNGEIIFGVNAILSFTDSPSEGCPPFGGDLEYTIPAPRPWLSPDNWCSSDTENGQCSSYPLLDSEKIPCATDDTVFPRGKSFYVDLSTGLNLNVKSLKITGKPYTTSSFLTLTQSDDGKRIFPPPKTSGVTSSSVTVSRQGCNDPTGCKCGNDQGQIFQQVCSVVSKSCDRAMCNVPIRPMGSCCDMCGAVFTGNVSTGFKIASFRSILQKFISDRNDNGTVMLITSKTGQGTIQAVLTGDNGDTSIPIALAIKADMDADRRGDKYRLDRIQLMESSGAIEPPSRQTGQLSGGGIAGIIVVLIVVAVVFVIVGLLLYRKRTGVSHNMIDDLMETPSRIRRSIPRGRRVPSDVTSRPAYDQGIEMDSGFGNPLYGDIGGTATDVRPMGLETAEIQPTFDIADSSGGFNNPLYDTVKKDGTLIDAGATSMTFSMDDSSKTDSNL